MLHVISIGSVSREVVQNVQEELIDQLNNNGGMANIYRQNKALFWDWKEQGVFLWREAAEERSPMKILQAFIEENHTSNAQLWTTARMNESSLRKLRTLEREGLIKFSCFLISQSNGQDSREDYKELERVIKISQNRPLGAEWVSVEKIALLIQNIRRSSNGLNYPTETLPKITSADDVPATETPLSRMMRGYYSHLKQRQILWYPKKYVHKKMDEEKWGVFPLPTHKQGKVKRHVLVTGTGRSGTTYFSDLLTLLGLDVGHQRNGKDGCSGAEFSVDHDWYPWFPVYGGGDCANVGERRSDYTYKHVLHIVRHPLWCIPSLMRNYPAINPEFWADYGVMDPVVMDQSSTIRNAAMYYGINKAIDDSGQAEYRCQLEEIHNHWSTLMDILELGKVPDPGLGATNKATGWGQYEPLTWSELELYVGKGLCRAIREQAERYGYQ